MLTSHIYLARKKTNNVQQNRMSKHVGEHQEFDTEEYFEVRARTDRSQISLQYRCKHKERNLLTTMTGLSLRVVC